MSINTELGPKIMRNEQVHKAPQSKSNKTQRLLTSFAAVDLLPEHCNYGDETPALRDFGVAPSVATALIRWGEKHDLVCTFENAAGRSNNAYSWKPEFLVAAVEKHLELFGDAGRADLPAKLLEYVVREQEYAQTAQTKRDLRK